MKSLSTLFDREFNTLNKKLNLYYLFFQYVDWNHIVQCIKTESHPLMCMRKIDPLLTTDQIMKMLLIYNVKIHNHRVIEIIKRIDKHRIPDMDTYKLPSYVGLPKLIDDGINIICKSKSMKELDGLVKKQLEMFTVLATILQAV